MSAASVAAPLAMALMSAAGPGVLLKSRGDIKFSINLRRGLKVDPTVTSPRYAYDPVTYRLLRQQFPNAPIYYDGPEDLVDGQLILLRARQEARARGVIGRRVNRSVVRRGFSGAGLDDLDPAAEELYQKIRAMTDDIEKIANHTGISREVIASVKQHMFMDVHDLPVGPNSTERARFVAQADIGELWLQARSGPLEAGELKRFERLMAHEFVERGLMKNGMPYRSLHPEAWHDGANFPTREHHGAHDLAPLTDQCREPYSHWSLFGMGRK